ncbi:thioredoxin [Alistipes sp. OttesenSCG-928-B03]|nr:thioredoxin [Alistipes sp. OttesenSCG-928-B03]
MKNIKALLFAAALIVGVGAASAQDRSIEFMHDVSWKEVVDAAKKQDRLIFVDCYTDWCGPCRKIAREVFTLNEVADFFNSNFVNAKFEMEKNADGPALIAKYDVSAYPTFLFINPHTEALEYVQVGGERGHEWLIEAGKVALNPEMGIDAMTKRYESGDRSPELVKNYIKLLGSLSQPEEQARVTNEYLASLNGNLYSVACWEIITLTLIDPLSAYFSAIVENRERFYEVADSNDVNGYLTAAISQATGRIVHPIWEPAAFIREQDADTRHVALIEALAQIDYPAAKINLLFLEAADMARRGAWDAVLVKIGQADASGLLDEGSHEYNLYRYNMIPLARDGGSRAQVAEAVAILEAKIQATDDPQSRRNYTDLRNRIAFMNK